MVSSPCCGGKLLRRGKDSRLASSWERLTSDAFSVEQSSANARRDVREGLNDQEESLETGGGDRKSVV